ncbi:hypothetical protein DRN84_03230 [Candidatus Geothermarchaeota archaeon]|nr:MAG: hypothetical protein DRN84_03230 [Candidatus Geothermarchaeota archaeon]
MKDIIKIIKKAMKLVMIQEDPSKYVEDAEKILKLFDEIDRYSEYIEDLEPLYHPIGHEVRLRKDEAKEMRIDMKKITYTEDGYVVAPPLRGKKKIS